MRPRSFQTSIALMFAAGQVFTASAQCFSDRLVANDPGTSDWFSTSAAVSGHFAVLGASGKDLPNAADAGAAYFFVKDGVTWSQVQRVSASDFAAGDNFGYCAAIDGDYAVIGSPRDTYSGFYHLGSAYVFHYGNGQWVQEYNILVPVANRAADLRFALSVGISGNTIVVGSEFEASGNGAAYVFTRNGTAWQMQQRIAGPASNGLFGSAVAVEGNHLIVGASLDNSVVGFGTGAAYVYERAGSSWSLASTLSGNGTILNSRFGDCVSLSAGRAVVVAPAVGPAGRAYTYVRNGLGHWLNDDSFDDAGSAALKDGTMLISRYGNNTARVDEYRYVSNQMFGYWAPGPSRSAGLAGEGFGWAVGFDGASIIAAAPSTPVSGQNDAGAAYAFERDMAALTGRCGTATPIGVERVVGCTQGHVREGYSGCDLQGTAPDVYFTFTAPCSATYAFDTAGSGFDTMLSLHSGCSATSANTIACNDDNPAAIDRSSRLTRTIMAGETVIVRVSGYQANAGVFALDVTASLPVNDDCAHPMTISEGVFSYDNCFADNNLQLDGYTLEGDLWYRYTPACTGIATLNGCGGDPMFDTFAVVYHGSTCTDVYAPNRVTAFDDSTCGGGFSYMINGSFPVTGGEAYLLRIGGYPFVSGTRYNRGHAMIDLELQTACPADFNQDGGVDGADVSAFFDAWGLGLASADTNCDGGVDGADVDAFFAAWENGGC